MINFFIEQILNILDWVYLNLHLSDLFTKINELFNYLSSYQNTWNSIMELIFFICGKPLVVFAIGVGVVIIICSAVMSLINIIGQYVP